MWTGLDSFMHLGRLIMSISDRIGAVDDDVLDAHIDAAEAISQALFGWWL